MSRPSDPLGAVSLQATLNLRQRLIASDPQFESLPRFQRTNSIRGFGEAAQRLASAQLPACVR